MCDGGDFGDSFDIGGDFDDAGSDFDLESDIDTNYDIGSDYNTSFDDVDSEDYSFDDISDESIETTDFSVTEDITEEFDDSDFEIGESSEGLSWDEESETESDDFSEIESDIVEESFAETEDVYDEISEDEELNEEIETIELDDDIFEESLEEVSINEEIDDAEELDTESLPEFEDDEFIETLDETSGFDIEESVEEIAVDDLSSENIEETFDEIDALEENESEIDDLSTEDIFEESESSELENSETIDDSIIDLESENALGEVIEAEDEIDNEFPDNLESESIETEENITYDVPHDNLTEESEPTDMSESTDNSIEESVDMGIAEEELEHSLLDHEIDFAPLSTAEYTDDSPIDVSNGQGSINENTDAEAAWQILQENGYEGMVNSIYNDENLSNDQKASMLNQLYNEAISQPSDEPTEYGARVKALTYDGRDIITKPPEDFDELTPENTPYGDFNAQEIPALSEEDLEAFASWQDEQNNEIESILEDESLDNGHKIDALEELRDNLTTAQETYDNYYGGNNLGTSSEFIDITNQPETFAEYSPVQSGNSEEWEQVMAVEPTNEEFIEEYEGTTDAEESNLEPLTEAEIDAVYDGLEEYDFQGVNALEDTERLDESLESFTTENWENLTLDEQKEKMQDLAEYVIDVTGLENPPQIEFYNNPVDGEYGGFNRMTNTLRINEHMLYQNDEAADTVAHELWHAHQFERASNPRTKTDQMYAENFNDYITPEEDFEGYQSQILESEARAFAQQIKDRLHSY